MEDQKGYRESYDELVRISKSIANDQVTLNFSKMDSKTKETLRVVLINTINVRQSAILNVLGNQITNNV
jgi:hypothetical protein